MRRASSLVRSRHRAGQLQRVPGTPWPAAMATGVRGELGARQVGGRRGDRVVLVPGAAAETKNPPDRCRTGPATSTAVGWPGASSTPVNPDRGCTTSRRWHARADASGRVVGSSKCGPPANALPYGAVGRSPPGDAVVVVERRRRATARGCRSARRPPRCSADLPASACPATPTCRCSRCAPKRPSSTSGHRLPRLHRTWSRSDTRRVRHQQHQQHGDQAGDRREPADPRPANARRNDANTRTGPDGRGRA